MKVQVRIFGLLAALIFLLGCIFKLQHLPGASILISLGSVSGIIYLVLYLLMGIKNLENGFEKVTGIIGAISLSIVLFSFLFKMMHWPGGSTMILISQAGLFLSGVLMLVDAYKEKDSNKQSLKALTSFTIFILLVILYFVTFLLNKLPFL